MSVTTSPNGSTTQTQAVQWGTEPPTPKPRAVVCPYCGQITGAATRCERCGGRFDPLSRQATQNAMGPWSFLDPSVPTRPGCSYETLRTLVERGTVRRDSVIRGPSTRQFWMLATRVPGVAHWFGVCHNCQRAVGADDYACRACGAVFEVERDRQHLGVGPIRLLPGQASEDRLAAAAGLGVIDHRAPAGAPSAGSGAASSPERVPADADERRRRLAERREAHRKRSMTTLIVAGALIVAAALIVLGVTLAGRTIAPATDAEPAGVVSP